MDFPALIVSRIICIIYHLKTGRIHTTCVAHYIIYKYFTSWISTNTPTMPPPAAAAHEVPVAVMLIVKACALTNRQLDFYNDLRQ